jgi:hypothetical protein
MVVYSHVSVLMDLNQVITPIMLDNTSAMRYVRLAPNLHMWFAKEILQRDNH